MMHTRYPKSSCSSFMNQISFGLKYWKKNYDSLVSSGWKCLSEIWCEEIESLLFTNPASLTCLPCSGLHLQETTDHCLHCEELLQLSFFSILLSQAAQDKQCLYLFRNLFTKYGLCQNLIDRIYASSVYISHLAGKVFVSLISLNPFQYFTENGFKEMVLLFIHHPQSHMDPCRGFLILKNILRTKLPKDVNAAYVNNHPIRIGSSNIQSHPKPNTEKNWTEFQHDCICPTLNMSLLRKLILLEFNVCAIAIRSEYFKNTSESKDTNVNVLEKILLKLQRMCFFIHYNLQAKSQLMREQVIDWLPQVFADQDNSWVQVLLAVTDLYVISKMWNEENRTAKKISTLINPHLIKVIIYAAGYCLMTCDSERMDSTSTIAAMPVVKSVSEHLSEQVFYENTYKMKPDKKMQLRGVRDLVQKILGENIVNLHYDAK
ncbi:unnamed protein product [Acanthosepion pharaonis]|uniref:Uncharacterized protein n=1 Tax=Acanthosepion pharaonis TaxID=158019 RepID=A0A812CIR4_ACAPH|nr:unnamed protein product [Sepia pharaonis]